MDARRPDNSQVCSVSERKMTMPSGSNATRILLQLNRLSRDLKWLKDKDHYQAIKQPGHFDSMEECDCFIWASIGPEMAEHIWGDMLKESRESIRAAIVEAAENGTGLEWEVSGETDARIILARAKDGVVRLHL